jgi:hypothetical protein
MRRAILTHVPRGVAVALALLIAADLVSAARAAETIPRASPTPPEGPVSNEMGAVEDFPEDPDPLTEVALNDPDLIRRLTAVTRLHSQLHLGRVMREAKDPGVRRVAVFGLTDRALIQSALEDSDPVVKVRAAGKWGGDPMVARLAMTDRDPAVAELAAQTIGDQATLAKVASYARRREARRAAISSLKDRRLQARLAVAEGLDMSALFFRGSSDTRVAVVAHMAAGPERDRLAAHLSEAEWDLVLRETTDPGLVARVWARRAWARLKDAGRRAREATTARWRRTEKPPPPIPPEDEEALLARARGSGPLEDRLWAISRLTAQDALFALARSDSRVEVRAAAAASLTHTHLLLHLVRHESDDRVRAAAVTRLTDQATLRDLARNDPSLSVRRAALLNSRDPGVWRDRAAEEPDAALRAIAARGVQAEAPPE